jgi:flagellar basal-body rod modification protein FlgD
MMVHTMSAATQPPAAGAAAAQGSPTDVTENEFLQLLVAQMKNQDPTNPTDSTTFVTQLAQFSQLEQIVAIRADIESQMAQSANQGSTAPQGGN